ncbi:hypothetical protein ACVWZ6_002641 [Bradyrhizobium sp. GM6.1]
MPDRPRSGDANAELRLSHVQPLTFFFANPCDSTLQLGQVLSPTMTSIRGRCAASALRL